MTPKRYRKKPVEIEAMQWDGTDPTAEALWEWTIRVVSRRADGSPDALATQFAVLDDLMNSDAVDILGADEVKERTAEGYSAIVYDALHGTWVNVATGDYVIRGVKGEFYPCRGGIFVATYDAVEES